MPRMAMVRLRPVGSFDPKGSSPFGAADMAGNGAEWTATPVLDEDHVVVKGGSFQSPPAELEVRSQTSQAKVGGAALAHLPLCAGILTQRGMLRWAMHFSVQGDLHAQ